MGQWDTAAEDETFDAWTERAARNMSSELRANGYFNLSSDRGPEWLRGLYGGEGKYRRLLEAKRQWDPHNLLRFNKSFKS